MIGGPVAAGTRVVVVRYWVMAPSEVIGVHGTIVDRDGALFIVQLDKKLANGERFYSALGEELQPEDPAKASPWQDVDSLLALEKEEEDE